MGEGGFDSPESVPPSRNPSPQSKLRGDAPGEYGQKLQIVVAGHYISRYRASKEMKLCWIGDKFATGFGPQSNNYCFIMNISGNL